MALTKDGVRAFRGWSRTIDPNASKVPETWIPISPRNPSKLTLHKFINGKWEPTCFVKCVAWPEMFGEE